jgi:hypothetical protein
MKIVATIVLSGLLILLCVQIYKFWGQAGVSEKGYLDFKAKLDAAKSDEAKLQADLNYYMNPANLEKELRARFNYRSPDEKLLIIVPQNPTATATSSPGR